MFEIMIKVLYVLLLIETYATSAGLYTVLSLIPTAGISVAVWLLKNNSINNGKGQDKQEIYEDTEKESATNESESPIDEDSDCPSD